MSTKENVAIGRRIEGLEDGFAVLDPVRITTTIKVYERADEPLCSIFEEVKAAALHKPKPRHVETLEDLDVLIDGESGVHVCRHQVDDEAFDLAAAGARHIEVTISCHRLQLPLIRSCLPMTETRGGTRAGKTIGLVWWLFRQWLLRGHDVDEDHLEPAKFWWIREDVEKLWEYAIKWILLLWPHEIFVGRMPTEKTKKAKIKIFDGSEIHFRHANFSGTQAATNLRSANVEAVVIDEKSAIKNRENWVELRSRVAQTHGPTATATTPTTGHWSERDTGDDAGGTRYEAHLDRFVNPWITKAASFEQMVTDRLVTIVQMEEKILTATDQIAAARDLIVDPDAQRAWLGRKVPAGITLWKNWRVNFVVRDGEGARDFIETEQRGRLPCITAPILASLFRRSDKPRPGKWWLGQDYNVNPCIGVRLQLFGDQHRRATWHVLVFDELAVKGPTVVYAGELAKRHGAAAGFGDPAGHMKGGHQSRVGSSTDAVEMAQHGHYVLPAGGRGEKGKALFIPQLDRHNIMHRLMHEGRLLVHARCVRLIEAFESMQANPDGTTKKVSGTGSKSDQVSGSGDACGYGIYPVMRHELTGEGARFGHDPAP